MTPGWLEYLRRARWFGVGDEDRLGGVEPLGWYTPAGSLPAVRSELARLADGEDAYHLLVGYLPAGTAEPGALVETTEVAELGRVDVVDAAASPTAMTALLNALRTIPGDRYAGSSGEEAVLTRAATGRGTGLDEGSNAEPLHQAQGSSPAVQWFQHPSRLEPVRLLGAEQSNSAVVAGDSLVKIFRRLSPGPNPEPELLAALAGGPVPALHGVLSQAGYDLLVATEFLPGARDGWEFATAACAAERPIDSELQQLGGALRQVHDGLAETFGTRQLAGAELRRKLLADLERAVGELPVLAPYRDALASVLTGVPDADLLTQRVHGDFHLGQALLVGDGWRIIDFEGEPGAPIAQRRGFDSRWRDVAGLLRSLDYVRSAHPEPDGPRAWAWCDRGRAAFLTGYGQDPAALPLVHAHEVARMVYEVGYEVRNRPDWVGIPLSAVKNVATRH
ncbi:MAG: phosphotransferase [Propionicimonas sp.]